ncbi:MAG: PfkB family carbohydrate kinase [Candidatus Omnitrophota bacterium]
MKIKTINELANILDDLRKKGRKIVHCHGVFDLLHPGHIKHFESAKKQGDVLVVTVTQDKHVNKGPGRPVFNQDLRAESVAALGCVDYVAVNEWPTAVEAITLLKPSFYIKGKEYARKEKDLTGKIAEEEDAVKAAGGVIHFTDDITFSSSSLINAHFTPYPEEAKGFFQKFRQVYSAEGVIDILKKTKDLKVLVIGDIIIDEYHYCAGMGKTTKDNIIATKFLNEEVFAGGILAAANHLAGFCHDVTLLAGIGTENDYRGFIKSRLKENIKTNFYDCQGSPTVVKRRFVDPNFMNKMFEICYLNDKDFLSAQVEDDVCAYLNEHLKAFDMVLVADFGHGLITRKIVDVLCEKAKFLAVNVQTNSSNIGFNLITKFHRADYICIDEPEIRLACQDKHSDVKDLIIQISQKLRCDKIVITRGHRGSLAYSKKDGFKLVPIFSKEVLDRIGAGDAYFSITAPCVCQGHAMETIGFIGNVVGAIKVLIVGNRSSVEPVPLYKYITTLLK